MELIGGMDEVGPTSSKFIIYGLIDPRTNVLRYIGKSTSGLKRAKMHSKACDLKRHGKTHKTAWIKELLSLGMIPRATVLLEMTSGEHLYAEEQRLIKEYRTLGADLTNHTDGGPGRLGYKLSEETKGKLRRAAIEQQKRSKTCHTEVTKESLRKLQFGRIHSDEARLHMARAHGAREFVELASGLVFESLSQAGRYFGIPSASIGRVLNGKRKTTHGLKFEHT
jgi:hypothetical protein